LKSKPFHIFVVNGMFRIISKFLIYICYVAFVQRKCLYSIVFCIWIFSLLMIKMLILLRNFFPLTKLFNFHLMNAHFVHWSFNDFIFLINMHQCFQLQNILCDFNKLQSNKWIKIATIIFLMWLHMYKHIYAHTFKQITQ